jgi:hypothetical protein
MKKKLFSRLGSMFGFIYTALCGSLISSCIVYPFFLGITQLIAVLISKPISMLGFWEVFVMMFLVNIAILPFSWGRMCKMFSESINKTNENISLKGV